MDRFSLISKVEKNCGRVFKSSRVKAIITAPQETNMIAEVNLT